jgi:hypothetical protein
MLLLVSVSGATMLKVSHCEKHPLPAPPLS